MNKLSRQNKIKQIIRSKHIGTQEELKHQLELEKVFVTQATLSRDMRELGLLNHVIKKDTYIMKYQKMVRLFLRLLRFIILRRFSEQMRF